ncbi:hypothetical protein ACFIOY_39610 [Bradyrhizobium sp. TZ2]
MSTLSWAWQRPIPASEASAAAIQGRFMALLGNLSDVHHRDKTQPFPAQRRALRSKMRGLTFGRSRSAERSKSYYIGQEMPFRAVNRAADAWAFLRLKAPTYQ